jgi:Flp pilus assembly protein TadG
MHQLSTRPCVHQPRAGMTLILFAILAPVLVGIVGLVVDAGLLMAAHRQAQNGADAAAVAAAMDLYRGSTSSTALATANSFLADNGLGVTLALNAGASNALNIPPQSGGYAGLANYVEAVVAVNVQTLLIQVLPGVNQTNQITARAVAGWETVGAGEGAVVLDPTAAPGLAVKSNNSRLIVNGTVVVNSQGSGVDQYGNAVQGSYAQPAVATSGPNTVPAPIVATQLQVVGGVDTIDNIRAYDPAFGPTNFYDPSNAERPVFARAPIAPDPLASLPVPSTSNGVKNVYYKYLGGGAWTTANSAQTVKLTDKDQGVVFNPGIYDSISITNNASASFNPGIYVLQGSKGNAALTINGTPTVTGNGVMFYNPGNGISINGSQITFTPYSNGPNDPFTGLVIYQDRSNGSTMSVAGNSNQLNLTGTVYAKTAQVDLAGTGKFNAQFIVGSMQISGGATVTINAGGKDFGRANLVFLVE